MAESILLMYGNQGDENIIMYQSTLEILNPETGKFIRFIDLPAGEDASKELYEESRMSLYISPAALEYLDKIEIDNVEIEPCELTVLGKIGTSYIKNHKAYVAFLENFINFYYYNFHKMNLLPRGKEKYLETDQVVPVPLKNLKDYFEGKVPFIYDIFGKKRFVIQRSLEILKRALISNPKVLKHRNTVYHPDISSRTIVYAP